MSCPWHEWCGSDNKGIVRSAAAHCCSSWRFCTLPRRLHSDEALKEELLLPVRLLLVLAVLLRAARGSPPCPSGGRELDRAGTKGRALLVKLPARTLWVLLAGGVMAGSQLPGRLLLCCSPAQNCSTCTSAWLSCLVRGSSLPIYYLRTSGRAEDWAALPKTKVAAAHCVCLSLRCHTALERLRFWRIYRPEASSLVFHAHQLHNGGPSREKTLIGLTS